MRILYVGDVVGRSGRSRVIAELPRLKAQLRLDVAIVNGENAAGGYGITAAIANELFAAGADAITMGNHVWDQRELIGYIDREPRIIRPLNLAPGTPGRGVVELRTARGQRVVVMQVLGRLFMGLYDDPFRTLEAELRRHALGGTAQAIVVDVHAEATSEKVALGHFLDGRVSLVAGTHTHVPTADARILPGGTGYITDVGMTGDYDSVIGMDKAGSLQRWRSDVPGQRLMPAMGEAMLCAVLVETDDRTGLARRIEPVRLGQGLRPVVPAELG
ncbi:TIGR00282 family metallophosphoesterase [Benzoatithermus flavus]|uniref:TIGR00282 family metallophosphoesterase n=1 Tax=Benzoatithermus flavus TaxID=3108223 RepID=A0ABU8XTH8_9PROT